MVRGLPIVTGPRALIPGTRMGLHTSVAGLSPRNRVVVVRGRAEPGTVATEARIDELESATEGSWYVRLTGIRLVAVADVQSDGVDRATVVPVDDGVRPAPDLIARAQRAVRTYHARRLEAGEWADVTIELTPDPVVASHEVASYLQISAPEIQELLEAGDAGDRLIRSIAILERETDLLARMIGRKGG